MKWQFLPIFLGLVLVSSAFAQVDCRRCQETGWDWNEHIRLQPGRTNIYIWKKDKLPADIQALLDAPHETEIDLQTLIDSSEGHVQLRSDINYIVNEPILIDRRLTMEGPTNGEQAVIICRENFRGAILKIHGSPRFTLRNVRFVMPYDDGAVWALDIRNSNNVTIDQTTTAGGSNGVIARPNTKHLILTRCKGFIHESGAVQLEGVENALIKNCEFAFNLDGIKISHTNNATTRDIRIIQCRSCLNTRDGFDFAQIEGQTGRLEDVHINNNTFACNHELGVAFKTKNTIGFDCERIWILGNTIQNNGNDEIEFRNSRFVMIAGNNVDVREIDLQRCRYVIIER